MLYKCGWPQDCEKSKKIIQVILENLCTIKLDLGEILLNWCPQMSTREENLDGIWDGDRRGASTLDYVRLWLATSSTIIKSLDK